MQTIVVLLKQTFDTEEKITVTPQGVEERDAKLVINPYDEYALEEALRLKERRGCNVVVVTCGPERAQEALRTALAVGADEAIRIEPGELGSDSHALAAALAAVVAPLAPDLLLAGLFAVDSGSGSIALQVAERLGLPHASAAVKLSVGSAAELGVAPVGCGGSSDGGATAHGSGAAGPAGGAAAQGPGAAGSGGTTAQGRDAASSAGGAAAQGPGAAGSGGTTAQGRGAASSAGGAAAQGPGAASSAGGAAAQRPGTAGSGGTTTQGRGAAAEGPGTAGSGGTTAQGRSAAAQGPGGESNDGRATAQGRGAAAQEPGAAGSGGTTTQGRGAAAEGPGGEGNDGGLYALVERDVEGDTETVVLPLPALITAQQGLNEPRYPSLPGIMKAKRKPLRVVALDEIGLGGREAGDLIRTRQIALSPPPPRAAGKRIGGSAAEQASELIKLLQDEAKVL